MDLTAQQIKKLDKLSRYLDDSNVAIIEDFTNLEEKVSGLQTDIETRFSGLQEELKKKLELDLQINPEDIRGQQGIPGINGRDGLNGTNGKDGKDGINGKDGLTPNILDIATEASRMTIEEVKSLIPVIPTIHSIVEGFETLELNDRLDFKYLKGTENLIDLDRAVSIVDNRTSFLLNKVSNLQTRVENIPQGVTSLTGTTNQVIASSPTGAVTLSLPQDIDKGATANFNKLRLRGTGILSGFPSYDFGIIDDVSNYFSIYADSNFATTFNTVSGAGINNLYIFKISGLEKVRISNDGSLGIGTGATVSAKLHLISTGTQFRSGYDVNNYLSATTNSTGSTVFNLTGTTPYFLFNQKVGIGTAGNFPADPQGKLEVSATAGTTHQRWSTDQSNYVNLSLSGSSMATFTAFTGTGGTSGFAFNGNTHTIGGLSYVKAGQTSSKNAGVGGKVKDFFTDAGNVTTGETDLYSYTTEVQILNTNGQELEGSFGGTFVSSGTATRQLKLYFGGTAIFDSGALSISTSSSWVISYSIMRVSGTVVRYRINLSTQGATLSAYTSVGELTGLTLTNTNILKITGTAAGVGASSNDIVASSGNVFWWPQAV